MMNENNKLLSIRDLEVIYTSRKKLSMQSTGYLLTLNRVSPWVW